MGGTRTWYISIEGAWVEHGIIAYRGAWVGHGKVRGFNV